MDFEELENMIEIHFKNQELLKMAFTHTSYAHEKGIESNEKLEFLGDAILEFVVSNYLYEKYKELREGEMTKVRAAVVCEDSLVCIAKAYNFSDFLLLGKSEIASNVGKTHSILADSVEALIGAIYLDLGIEAVKGFIIKNLAEPIEEATKNVGAKDHKTILQEKLQENGDVLIEYRVIHEEGPDHNKIFTVEVFVNKKSLAKRKRNHKKSSTNGSSQKSIRRNKIRGGKHEKTIYHTNICTTLRM